LRRKPRKRKGSLLARWEAKPSRSQGERIKLKMGAAQAEEVEAKKGTCKGQVRAEWEDTVASQKYTPGISRARGSLQCISFFFRLIGFKG
jgi:hypothetical protein